MRRGAVLLVAVQLCATGALSAKQCIGTIQGRVERANGDIEPLSHLSYDPVDTVVLGPLDSLYINGEYSTPYCYFPYGSSLVIDHNGTQTVVPAIVGVNMTRPFTRVREAGLYDIIQSTSTGWFDFNISRRIFIVWEETTVSTGAVIPPSPLNIGYADGAIHLFGELLDGTITLFAADARIMSAGRVRMGSERPVVPVGHLPKGVYIAALDDVQVRRTISRFVVP